MKFILLAALVTFLSFPAAVGALSTGDAPCFLSLGMVFLVACMWCNTAQGEEHKAAANLFLGLAMTSFLLLLATCLVGVAGSLIGKIT